MALRSVPGDGPGFGLLSHRVKDHVYMIGRRGFIYTAPWINTSTTRPPSAALLLAVGNGRFAVNAGGREIQAGAVLIPPFVPRALIARDVPVVGFHVTPSSCCYDRLTQLAAGRVRPLEREWFSDFDGDLDALFHGHYPAAGAPALYQAVLREPFRHLRAAAHGDPRGPRIRALLEQQPELSLSQLAEQLGMSYFWASRLMREVFGMSLRDYKAWRKLQRVFELLHSRRSLTDIAHAAGFTDSAHLSRTYQRWFGQPPSYSRNRNHVRIVRCW
ncbi:helix-turn-helix domain-containing protein [Alloalcanivorax sp. C16-1]|uniref:helix-turn-helix domain-containing protein n=1 Tax=Alloalcanivorax sp. C16-1 TaxID=3390051 RepID=UPI00397047A2